MEILVSSDPRWPRRRLAYLIAFAVAVGLATLIVSIHGWPWASWIGIPGAIAVSTYGLIARADLRAAQKHRVK